MMRVRLLGVLALVLFTCTAASAQSIPSFGQFFSVSTPGARANGMGRAFVGVADDATAAVTNPAGLTFLTRPQVYVEFKSSMYDQTIDQLPDNGIKSLRARLPFFAISAPLLNDKIAVAFSRNEFFGINVDLPAIGFQEHVYGTSYSGSVAFNARRDLKLGVTLSGGRLSNDLNSDTVTKVGVTFGGLYQANEKVSIGVSGTKWAGSGSSDTFVAPSQIKFGVGVTPNPQWKVAFDVVRVTYPSDLADDSNEVHLGTEYGLMPIGQNRVFLRAGVFTGRESSFDQFQNLKSSTKAAGTFGAGVAFGQLYQLDLAVLTRKEVVVSAAVRF